MRLKHKPGSKEKIAAHPQYITTNGEAWQGKWQERFPKKQPLHLEIGSGKGRYIVEMAKRYPEINFIGMEVQTSVIATILDKQIEERLPNLQLLNGYAQELTNYFARQEVDRVLLTFSDPWPKSRHEKRRLTYRYYLERYETVLKPEGELYFKTDNQGLFEYSLMSLNHYGMCLDEVILDLHQSDQAEENIMTEFEEKFSKKGRRIYQLRAHFQNK